MQAPEIKQAREKVRQRERAIWDDVERIGRQARAAEAAKAVEVAKPRETAAPRRREVERS